MTLNGKVRPLRVVVFAIVGLGFIGFLVLVRQVMNLADSLLLQIYSKPARLPILWYPDVDESVSRQPCRLCDKLKLDVIYPFETNGLLEADDFLKWAIVSPFLNESLSSSPLSTELERLRAKTVFDGAAANVSFVPCIKSTLFLHHGRRFWHSNTLEMFFYLPQEKQELTISHILNTSFHLLNRPATYELELKASLGFCYDPTELDQYNTQHFQHEQQPLIGLRLFEPQRVEDRTEVQISRIFYSLQYSHELAAFMERQRNNIDTPNSIETEVFTSSVVSSLPIVLVPFRRPITVVQSDDDVHTEPSTSSSAVSSTPSPQFMNASNEISASQSMEEFEVSSTTTASKLQVDPAQLPPHSFGDDADDDAEHHSTVTARTTLAMTSKELETEETNHRKSHVHSSGINIDMQQYHHTDDGIDMRRDTNHSNNQKNNSKVDDDGPIIRRRRRLHIDHPTRHSVLSIDNRTTDSSTGGVQDAWKLRVNVPLAFFKVPLLQLGIEIDGQRFSIALSDEELSRVWMDEKVPNKQAKVEAMWSQSITPFIQHTGTPTAQTLYQLYKPQPGGEEQRLELYVPDFYPDFLRSQTYTAALWMSAQYRHTLYLALPELERGWHHLYVFATVPRHYLAHRLHIAMEHQTRHHQQRQQEQADQVEYEANGESLLLEKEVLAFDIVQFEVR